MSLMPSRGAGGQAAVPQPIHASLTYGCLALDACAFGPGAAALRDALECGAPPPACAPQAATIVAMIAAVWIVVGLGLALWSLFAWGLYRLLLADPGWLGDVEALLDRVPYGDVLERWLPGWQAIAAGALDALHAALGWLGGAAPVVAGVAWGAGALALLIGGGLLTLVIVLLRDKPQPKAAS